MDAATLIIIMTATSGGQETRTEEFRDVRECEKAAEMWRGTPYPKVVQVKISCKKGLKIAPGGDLGLAVVCPSKYVRYWGQTGRPQRTSAVHHFLQRHRGQQEGTMPAGQLPKSKAGWAHAFAIHFCTPLCRSLVSSLWRHSRVGTG